MKGDRLDYRSLTRLESRLHTTEDKLAIYEQIASYRPSADTGHTDYTSLV
ncbi:hypothetical protein [Paenibacillus periandrae]|nr:hypothetical protein [Paenibacillus periandrae]